METYLITGGAGFVGLHLAEYLLEKGHSVHCVDSLLTGSPESIGHLLSQPRFKFVEGRLEDQDVLATAARGCCGIFHVAAMGSTAELNSAVIRFAAEHSMPVMVTSSPAIPFA